MKRIERLLSMGLLLLLFSCRPAGLTRNALTAATAVPDSIRLIQNGQPLPLLVSAEDHAGVRRVADHLRDDFERVCGRRPDLYGDRAVAGPLPLALIVGTLGQSPLIDQLVTSGKLDTSSLSGRREKFIRLGVPAPLPGVARALVIVGSDKRGTIYGMYELSRELGVSPWYWWADVPVSQRSDFSICAAPFTLGEPKVQYRGIFINDEAPALAGWAQERYGGFNARFYDQVFELILRLRGNYLWPAMWGRAIYDDDPQSPRLADEYGIVIGTSHHEPLMRAHVEWERYGNGPWNYDTNAEALRAFWRQGIARMGTNESIITLGMRGDGDEPMSEAANIALLERIVADQRRIISEQTGKPAAHTPQVWALYKEVQEYYDRGMTVPDDVTLLLCDDNWGNIRRLPPPNAPPRTGGYGIYYHYDYVGGPRNYKWLNTNPLPRIWEQMHLAYEQGVRKIWIVNVGDIKPMEFPTSFFLDYAWNPEAWPLERLPEYAPQWASEQFGPDQAREIGELLAAYAKFNGRRKPELLDATTYSLTNYAEASRALRDYQQLAQRSRAVYDQIPAQARDAYYQLVHFPILAGANLYELYVTAGYNRLYASQGRARTNSLAGRVQTLFEQDSLLTRAFHTELAGGKWNHMMSQTHIGYTYWQQPPHNSAPRTERLQLPEPAAMGVALPGTEQWWPAADAPAVLPDFDAWHRPTYTVDIFNRGQTAFSYHVEDSPDWLLLHPASGQVDDQVSMSVRIDWARLPATAGKASFTLVGSEGSRVSVQIRLQHYPAGARGFVEANGYIAIEAPHFDESQAVAAAEWKIIPDLGRTLGAVSPFPVDAAARRPAIDAPWIAYDIHTRSSGRFPVTLYLSPTLNFHATEGLRIALSVDERPPVWINMHSRENFPDWNAAVADNIVRATATLDFGAAGNHRLRVWMVDPAVVLQRIVIETGGLRPSYLGPPESARAAESRPPGRG